VPRATDASLGRTQSRPLVSILTPSFNQRRWLAQTLDSVARQTYPEVEHVVADGGSTDGSVELLRASLPAGRWLSEPDGGQSHALNKALERSRGEIVGWLNSDDAYLFDDVVEEVVEYFRVNPSVDVVYGHAALLSEGDRLLHVLWAPRFDRRLLEHFNFICQPTVFMRRGTITQRFADESFHYTMDRELWLRLSREHEFGRIDKVLAVDRHQPERKTSLRPDLLDAELARLVDLYGLPSGPRLRLERRLRKIAYRVRGAPTALRLQQGHKAFDWTLDGRVHLLGRQLLQKRRFMTRRETSDAGPHDRRSLA
jgi:glycosyltransferase involved in cell wall biosynthesis